LITVAIAPDLGPFDGPLDLLLALVRRNQYPLDALPIAEITGQYLSYIKDAKKADVELGGDFLETASWLVLLKSRALLPQAPGEEAPSHELERALLDHETLKATAGLLRSRLDAAGLGPGSGMTAFEPGLPIEADERVPAHPTVQDALLAARRALAVARAHAAGARSLDGESYPVAEILAQLDRRIQALEPGCGVSTREWFAELPAPEARVTLLLALLELARLQKVLLGQREEFGAVLLKRLPLGNSGRSIGLLDGPPDGTSFRR
jgi:segregation and condensation protein A